MNTTIKTLATVTALGADAVISGGFLYVADMPPMFIKGIKPTSIIAPVTEVLQVSTLVPTTLQNNTNFKISLGYVNKVTGDLESTILSFDSDANMLPQEVCDGFRAVLAAKNSIIPITGSGSTTLVLTAQAGYSTFTVTSVGVGVFTTAPFLTIAGVTRVGYGLDLINSDYTDSNLVSTSYYYSVFIKYGNSDTTGSSQKLSALADINVLYVLSTATNISTLVGALGSLTLALTGAPVSAAGTMTALSTMAYTQATGVLTMTGGAATWSSQGIKVGDIISIDGIASTVYLPVLIETTNLLGVSTIGLNGAADIVAGPYHIIHTS